MTIVNFLFHWLVFSLLIQIRFTVRHSVLLYVSFFLSLSLASPESFCHDLSFCFRPNYCNRSASSLSDSYNNDIVEDRRFLHSNERNYIIKHSEKKWKLLKWNICFFVRFQTVFFSSTDKVIEEKVIASFSSFFSSSCDGLFVVSFFSMIRYSFFYL